jgi:hypothetical protein
MPTTTWSISMIAFRQTLASALAARENDKNNNGKAANNKGPRTLKLFIVGSLCF